MFFHFDILATTLIVTGRGPETAKTISQTGGVPADQTVDTLQDAVRIIVE